MKKLFILASCAVLCSGFAFSIYQAANDYGMKENKLHSAIVAQSGSSSGGETDGDVVYYNKSIKDFGNTRYEYSGDSGTIHIKSVGGTNSLTVSNLRKNTYYFVSYSDRYCMADPSFFCNHDEERMTVKGLVADGSETTGGGK